VDRHAPPFNPVKRITTMSSSPLDSAHGPRPSGAPGIARGARGAHPAFTARPSRLPPFAVLTGLVPAFLAALIVAACGLARWHGERAAVPHGAPA
jgi:hypothetical protein